MFDIINVVCSSFQLSKNLHLNGTFSRFTFLKKNICKSNYIDMSDISGMNYKKEISKFSKNIKKKLKKNMKKYFLGSSNP